MPEMVFWTRVTLRIRVLRGIRKVPRPDTDHFDSMRCSRCEEYNKGFRIFATTPLFLPGCFQPRLQCPGRRMIYSRPQSLKPKTLHPKPESINQAGVRCPSRRAIYQGSRPRCGRRCGCPLPSRVCRTWGFRASKK